MSKKLLAFVLMLLTVLSLFGTAASAAERTDNVIMPRYQNVVNYVIDFYVTSGGQLCVTADYDGTPSTFTQAKITVEIEKKFLGLFWFTVDIGYEDDLWVAYSTDVNGSFINTFASDGTGTYRANIKLEISGMFGTDDVIEKTIECVYQ